MKQMILTVAALSTLAIAGAATAQPYGGDGYRNDYRNDYRGGWDQGRGRDEGRQLEMRIDRAVRNGAISPREAQVLRVQVNEIQRLQWRYQRDGLSRWEASDIARRYDSVRARFRWERADRDGVPGQGYGYGYGYGSGNSWR